MGDPLNSTIPEVLSVAYGETGQIMLELFPWPLFDFKYFSKYAQRFYVHLALIKFVEVLLGWQHLNIDLHQLIHLPKYPPQNGKDGIF